MTTPSSRKNRAFIDGLRRQRGAAAVEFAIVFVVFFALFYAIVSYGMVFMLLQGFSFAANEGARAAIAVDRMKYANEQEYLANGVRPRVQKIVSDVLGWLPSKAYDLAVGPNGSKVNVQLTDTGGVRVSIIYPDYATNPLIPIITLPAIGAVPKVPQNLEGVSVVGI